MSSLFDLTQTASVRVNNPLLSVLYPLPPAVQRGPFYSPDNQKIFSAPPQFPLRIPVNTTTLGIEY